MAVTSSSIAAVSRQLEDVRRERGSEADIERCQALSEGEEAAESIIAEAEKKRSKKRGYLTSALVFLVCTVITLASYLLITLGIFDGVPAVITIALAAVGAVSAVVSAVCFILFAASSKDLKKHLAAYGAVNFEELEGKLSELVTAYERDKQLASQINALETELYVKYTAYDDEIKLASRLLALRGVSVNADEIPERVRDVLSEVEEICTEEKKLSLEIEEKRAEANELERELHGISESEVRRVTSALDISEYDAMPQSQLKLERDFNENAVTRLTEAVHELEIKRTQMLAVREDPAELAVKLEGVANELKNERDRYEACVLAMETLSMAKESVRESIVPRIRELARGYMSRITNGKYENLGVDGGFSVTVDADGAYRELEYMSEGTGDAAYLSLRLALIDLLYRKSLPPLVFDEAFARMDDERTISAMKLLCGVGNQEVSLPQVMIFTCQKREGVIAMRIAPNDVSHIKLQ